MFPTRSVSCTYTAPTHHAYMYILPHSLYIYTICHIYVHYVYSFCKSLHCIGFGVLSTGCRSEYLMPSTAIPSIVDYTDIYIYIYVYSIHIDTLLCGLLIILPLQLSGNARGAKIRNILSSIIQSETIYVECLNKMIQVSSRCAYDSNRTVTNLPLSLCSTSGPFMPRSTHRSL